MQIKINGKLTAGYYNDMEAGYPVFINGTSLSDLIKNELTNLGYNNNFCYGPFESEEDVKNKLIGKDVELILNINLEV